MQRADTCHPDDIALDFLHAYCQSAAPSSVRDPRADITVSRTGIAAVQSDEPINAHERPQQEDSTAAVV